MPANQLAHQKSPYLLQHANNPVHWYPWGEEAFARARSENKPIFLSIGYSTCHWCHVMEHESFENGAIADLLNRHFVSIKVDREERPDVDRIYMTFVQATTGSGGWPMSVFLTPDLKPFFGGTYFPPDDRYGRPGFGAVLQQIAEVWSSEAGRSKVLESGAGILEELRSHTASAPAPSAALDRGILDKAFFTFRRMYDSRHGGFGQAPKFPRPAIFHFLLRYGHATGNEEAFEMTYQTLRAMAEGGMNDQLGGGFHRYSVDERWFVSHFEKMLYDQAQLAISYLEAFQLTGDPFFAGVARGIFDYVLRDMSHPEGGFYSAEDADSVIDPARPEEKGEGAFYIWTWREIAEALGPESGALFAFHYGVEREGNVADDPHGEFTQRNILAIRKTLEETAAKFGKTADEVNQKLGAARAKLLELRSRRIRPHLDDKILTAWNALMISAFAKGAQVLDDRRYLEAAQRAADFVLGRLYNRETGILLRRYRDGEAAIEGFLDDYAFFLQALTDLYEADFRTARLAVARSLADKMTALFGDAGAGGFFSTAEGDPALVLRIKEEYDGAEPAGNSVAALALLRLAELTGEERYRTEAERTFRALAPRIAAQPVVAPYLLAAVQFSLEAPRHVIIAGPAADPATAELLRRYRTRFLPDSLLLLIDSAATREELASGLPFVRDMHELKGRPAAYVCQNYACQLPVSDPEKFSSLLK